MNRVFISIGPINIYWYSVIIVASIIIGIYLSERQAIKNGLGKKFLDDLLFYLIPIAVVGARLYYVIFNFSLFKDDLISIFRVWEGGLAIYGAVISSLIFIIYYSKKHNKNAALVIDTLVPYLILGQALGRWGNFINKEAHGTLTTLSHLKSMHLPSFIIEGMNINGLYYIPTFLYESIIDFLGFIVLLIIRKRNNYKNPTLLMCIYFIWYGIGRFIVESMRTDSLYIGIFRVSQIVSVILVVIGIIGLIMIYKRRKNEKV